ncbi:MAG: hypothetical protein RRZ34_00505 [Malacoplasma sp.]
MSKFLKNFFKTIVIIFGILFVLAILGAGVVIFLGLSNTTQYFGFTIDATFATALGLTGSYTMTDFIMAVIANLFTASSTAAASLKTSLVDLSWIISISMMAISSSILGLWMLFSFIYGVSTKKIAGLYFSKNKDKQLWQLERTQDKIGAKIDSLKGRNK